MSIPKKVLRKGAKGMLVKILQRDLNASAITGTKLQLNGTFDKETFSTVKEYQKKKELKVDGIVGEETWNSLSNTLKHSAKFSNKPLQAPLADIATQYIGVTETGQNQAGESKLLKEIFDADDLVIKGKTDGYPWCAAFVSLCVQKFLKKNPVFSGVIAPREASVSRFANKWAKEQKCTIFKSTDKNIVPEKGDIVVFKFSHIGIVESVSAGSVITIEGNTNEKGSRDGKVIARKTRPYAIIKYFIRMPIALSSMNTRLDFKVA